ncbi:hypothetical protein QYF49_15220 [Fictibacillus sp. CENA-BCM004]|uniref:Uncharacterized protein n=1 Tax=Fictibacillus terranigra TaxID=3058424 RepID=A0ABT8E8U2_9BACL|nr:hypothetical protein [Fictibacillus sp. CENA-BCM004]MDN4074337.1 hypothetical protein [Fictibacillus sp. CENA-BCM004]
MNDKWERLLWSVALPGVGQLLNKDYIKGFLFLLLEMIINLQANFNQIILLSFHGRIEEAMSATHYNWLMFYPCFYFFSLWDAYKNATDSSSKFAFFPFVFAAFSVTIGLIYSPVLYVFGKLWGPVWLPILFLFPGLMIGFIFRGLARRYL